MDKISEKIFNELYALHDHYDEDPQHMICAEAADYIKNLSQMLAQSSQPANEPLACEGCEELMETPNPCFCCKRHWPDRYARKPEGSENDAKV